MMFENRDSALDVDCNGFRSIRMIMNRNPDKEEIARDDWFGSRFDEISDVFLDKKVMEYPSVKLIDCCRTNSCSVVKDIVIDEGMPLNNKNLLENGNNKMEEELSKEPSNPEILDSEKFDFSIKTSFLLRDLMERDKENEKDTNKIDQRSTPVDFKSSIDKVLGRSPDSANLMDDSDPVACPNGASFRSNSGSMSNRSFAFPILQSEWNASPVKMAKADGRQLRKLRGWRLGLFCCRF